MCVWRKIVAKLPSTRSASSERRTWGSLSCPSCRSNTMCSANVEATSASASGGWCESAVWRSPASSNCMPWPSSCASVRTSSSLPRKFIRMNGRASWATDAQNAPPRLPWRGSASSRRSAKRSCAMRSIARRELAERAEHGLDGLAVVDRATRAERRVLVGEHHPVDAEQPRLVRPPAVGQRVVALDRVEHRRRRPRGRARSTGRAPRADRRSRARDPSRGGRRRPSRRPAPARPRAARAPRRARRRRRCASRDPRSGRAPSSSEIVWSRPSNGICSVDVTWSNSVCQAPCATGSRSASMRSSSSRADVRAEAARRRRGSSGSCASASLAASSAARCVVDLQPLELEEAQRVLRLDEPLLDRRRRRRARPRP